MSSQIRYKMQGFNVSQENVSSSRSLRLKNNSPYYYKNHNIFESVFIDSNFSTITFTMLPNLEAKDYLNEISDELEKICFNIIAYSEVSTLQPFCSVEMITNVQGKKIEMKDTFSLRDRLKIHVEIESSSFYESVMNKNTPVSDYKAIYKELFLILHNPHEVIQFIALYDILLNLICSPNKGNKQKQVHDFFGKNKSKYPYIQFFPCNNDPSKNEDTFTHLRNNIAHSKSAGIHKFYETSQSITHMEIASILQVINDIISGETNVL